jgi:hypothetical protein
LFLRGVVCGSVTFDGVHVCACVSTLKFIGDMGWVELVELAQHVLLGLQVCSVYSQRCFQIDDVHDRWEGVALWCADGCGHLLSHLLSMCVSKDPPSTVNSPILGVLFGRSLFAHSTASCLNTSLKRATDQFLWLAGWLVAACELPSMTPLLLLW